MQNDTAYCLLGHVNKNSISQFQKELFLRIPYTCDIS